MIATNSDLSDINEATLNIAKNHEQQLHEEKIEFENFPTLSHQIASSSGHDTNPLAKGVDASRSIDEDPDADSTPFTALGMAQEDIAKLIRRFNHLAYRVTAVEEVYLCGFDVNTSEAAQSSPEQFETHMARFYMSVVINMFTFWKHIVRLRSWKEYRRTSVFMLVYVVALLINQLAAVTLVFCMALTISPLLRDVCFPFVPPNTVDAKTGGYQQPPAGVMGTEYSMTGAPEHYHGETLELEANSFFASLSSLITDAVSDKQEPEESLADNSTSSKVAKISQKISKVKQDIKSSGPVSGQDQTKQPMERAVQDFQVLQLMGTFVDFIDTWERVGNAICPAPMFQYRHARLIVASCFMPFILVNVVLSRGTILKCFEILIGIVFFGQPLFRETRAYLDRKYPTWREACQLRNTLLRRIPTNPQLAITILRAGERNNSPLLLDPISHAESESDVASTRASTTQSSLESRSKVERLMEFLKRTSKRSVMILNKVDEAKAKGGNENAQQRLDLGHTTNSGDAMAGPARFPACFKGAHGYIHVMTTTDKPSVKWINTQQEVEDSWSIEIDSIQSLAKMSGLGGFGQSVVRGAFDKEALNGMVITTKDGTEYYLNKVVRRDVLFNRLIGLGNQVWELR